MLPSAISLEPPWWNSLRHAQRASPGIPRGHGNRHQRHGTGDTPQARHRNATCSSQWQCADAWPGCRRGGRRVWPQQEFSITYTPSPTYTIGSQHCLFASLQGKRRTEGFQGDSSMGVDQRRWDGTIPCPSGATHVRLIIHEDGNGLDRCPGQRYFSVVVLSTSHSRVPQRDWRLAQPAIIVLAEWRRSATCLACGVRLSPRL